MPNDGETLVDSESQQSTGDASKKTLLIMQDLSDSDDCVDVNDLLLVAIDSGSRADWLRVLSFPRDAVVKAASATKSPIRPNLFNKLRKLFPDLHAASLVNRKIGTAAFGEDVFALAHAYADQCYYSELNRCFKVDAAILSSIIELREAVQQLRQSVQDLKRANDTSQHSSDRAAVVAVPGTLPLPHIASHTDSRSAPRHGAEPASLICPDASCSEQLNSSASHQQSFSVASQSNSNGGDCGAFTTVGPRGKAAPKSFAFIHNIEKSFAPGELRENLRCAGYEALSVQKFARAQNNFCSFKVGLSEQEIKKLVSDGPGPFLPERAKIRFWTKNKPALARSQTPRTRQGFQTAKRGKDVSTELVSLLTKFLSGFRIQAGSDPRS